MDSHDLLRQVMKNIHEQLDEMYELTGELDDGHTDWVRVPKDSSARAVQEMLESLTAVKIDGKDTHLHYNEQTGEPYYISGVKPLGWTHVPWEGPIHYTDMDGNVLKTEAPGTSLRDAVPPWQEEYPSEAYDELTNR